MHFGLGSSQLILALIQLFCLSFEQSLQIDVLKFQILVLLVDYLEVLRERS